MTTAPTEPLPDPDIVPSGDPVGPGTTVPDEPQPPTTEPQPVP
ncbi:hypothetical protein [Nocardioides okcheonensis]|nr:hypothetical protein [Nocardioides okcheonensis]